jgi:hypothetical protein
MTTEGISIILAEDTIEAIKQSSFALPKRGKGQLGRPKKYGWKLVGR